jgi:UDP-N-acetylglucosamine acyltransferase
VPGEHIEAIKNVTFNEPFFTGHFPHRPLMPGVMILEALAQAAGILAFKTAGVVPDEETRFYFVGIDGARFRKPVEPGDQLVLKATARAGAQGHLEVLDRGGGRRPRGRQRHHDGGAGGQVVIDPRAIVSSDAQLAPDVEVGPFTVIGAGVVIGAGTWIGPHAVINGPTTLGRDCKVFQFASIGDAPQDKKYRGEPTRLEVGDRNVFREFCTINRGTVSGHGVTRIGDDNLFMAYSHVAHDCIVGNKCVMSNCTALAGHVELGDWVILSGYAAVHQFCKVGAHAFLANNAAVTRDVPPYLMVAGSPPSRRASTRKVSSAATSTPADRQHQERLPRALPFGPQARRGDRAAEGACRNAAGGRRIRGVPRHGDA